MQLFVGIGAGCAAGLLWAPRRGKYTRNLIRRETRLRLRFARRRSHQLQSEMSRLKQRGVRLLTAQGEAVKTAIAAGKRAYQRAAAA
jgi:gas vesicle protein